MNYIEINAYSNAADYNQITEICLTYRKWSQSCVPF